MSSKPSDFYINIEQYSFSVKFGYYVEFGYTRELRVQLEGLNMGGTLYNCAPIQLRPNLITARSRGKSATLVSLDASRASHSQRRYVIGRNLYAIDGELEQYLFADVIMKAQDLRQPALQNYIDYVAASFGRDVLDAGKHEGIFLPKGRPFILRAFHYLQEYLSKRGMGHYLRESASRFLEDEKRAQIVTEITRSLEQRIKDTELTIEAHENAIEEHLLDIAVHGMPDQIRTGARTIISHSPVSATNDAMEYNAGLSFNYLMFHVFNNHPRLIDLLQEDKISSVEQVREGSAKIHEHPPRNFRVIRGKK